MTDRKLLGIYLNDHLAGATAGLELVRRARGENEGSELGDVLAHLADEIEADRRALEGVMEDLEIGRDHPKVLAAWVAEKIGRLKPNGQILGYSPLSKLVELEGLALGIQGKLSLWRALIEIAGEDDRLDPDYLGRLAERAERQRDQVERQRLLAAREAFAEKAGAQT
jgi:hypothetical protein